MVWEIKRFRFTADGDVKGEGQGVDLDPAIAAEHVGAAVGEIRKEFSGGKVSCN